MSGGWEAAAISEANKKIGERGSEDRKFDRLALLVMAAIAIGIYVVWKITN